MVPDNQSIIQFLTYLSANTRMRMQEDLQAISELDRLSKLNTAAIIKSHRFSFRLKRTSHYRIFQYTNVRNKELIIKVNYTRHFFSEQIKIDAWFDFSDVDISFLETLVHYTKQLPPTPTYLIYAS
ncbi:hypothetical protein [Enterococcus bulliens]